MISPHSFASHLSRCQLDAIHTGASDTGVPLEIHGLETARELLGGTRARVTRHSSEGCQLDNHAGSFMEIDPALNDLFVHSAQGFHERPVRDAVQAPGKQTIFCTCCHRRYSFEHGWMHWDHQNNFKVVHGTFRTVCEKCALALYSDVLQNTV